MPFRAHCRIPPLKSHTTRSREGSCPELLYDYIRELEGASEIHIAAYLFNNVILLEALEQLAKMGCKITITTLPPNGYKDKKLKVEGYDTKVSAQELAEACFKKILKTKCISLKFYPHQYMWYGALYAGGGASYSFHIKSALAIFPDGGNKCMLGSGNFMVSDPCHSDNFLVIENEDEYYNQFSQFYSDLERLAISANSFHNKCPSMREEFLYGFKDKGLNITPEKNQKCFFSAPFYSYGQRGSNHYAGDRIIDFISRARKRVWICAQHFHDLLSFDPDRRTIISELYRLSNGNKDIDFRFLKQVPHSSLADKRRAGIAECLFQFEMQSQQRTNPLVHDKFILADNKLLVSTGNFTPSQFAFGLRKMKYEAILNGKKVKDEKLDIFSEVNAYALVQRSPAVVKKYESHFKRLWDNAAPINIEL